MLRYDMALILLPLAPHCHCTLISAEVHHKEEILARGDPHEFKY